MSKVIFFKLTVECLTMEQTLESWRQGRSVKLLLGENSKNFGCFKCYGHFFLTLCKERIADIKDNDCNNLCLYGDGFMIAIDFSQGIGSLTIGTN